MIRTHPDIYFCVSTDLLVYRRRWNIKAFLTLRHPDSDRNNTHNYTTVCCFGYELLNMSLNVTSKRFFFSEHAWHFIWSSLIESVLLGLYGFWMTQAANTFRLSHFNLDQTQLSRKAEMVEMSWFFKLLFFIVVFFAVQTHNCEKIFLQKQACCSSHSSDFSPSHFFSVII